MAMACAIPPPISVAPKGVNSDFSQKALMNTREMPWQASPSPTVWRKRLDLQDDPEHSRVTSVVRYDPRASFRSHPHPRGEEILVLEGVFSDEHGDNPAGSYLLHPKGFNHAPFSRDGCLILVKLCQYVGDDRPYVSIDTSDDAKWQLVEGSPGLELFPLYDERPKYPEVVALERLAPQTTLTTEEALGGKEIFVMEGELEDENGTYPEGTWLRLPPGASHTARSTSGCKLYVKRYHLANLI